MPKAKKKSKAKKSAPPAAAATAPETVQEMSVVHDNGHLEEATLSDLVPDDRNARKHNPRNMGVIADSLQEIGAWRSIAIDENNKILAGNGVVEAAGEVGIHKVRIVEAKGDEIIAVRRRGLTEKQKLDYALRDNRAAELAEWDEDVLAGIAEEMDLSHLFREDELDKITQHEQEDSERIPEMGLRPDEKYNYAVLVFKDQSSWDRACDLLGIQEKVSVNHGGVTKIGMGRVLVGNDAIERLRKK